MSPGDQGPCPVSSSDIGAPGRTEAEGGKEQTSGFPRPNPALVPPPTMSLSQRPQQTPTSSRPQDLTHLFPHLPASIHYRIPLALAPKQTSHAPHCSPSHGAILAPYLSISHLEICLHPSPPVHPPHQVILPKYKPNHVIPLLNIQWLPGASGSSPPMLLSLALQPHFPKGRL